ncbi:MerR family transcriptional regulator [Pseudotabrizicola sp. L79]|uniref:MerR family transcriptional regulator n=1 Tax=Pseudotabrizicola sp. L79 TaxID=3118402 RepID=UPI002F920426
MEKSPDAFRTISEVAEFLETPAHVLRFWESRFPQIRPVKRAGGRRYYRPADVALLTGIKRLLHDDGMTIRGVQKILREQGVRYVSGMADETSTEDDDAALEAALAAVSGAEAPETALPHDEAETAQIIALRSALGPQPATKDPAHDSQADLTAASASQSDDAGDATTATELPQEAQLPAPPPPPTPLIPPNRAKTPPRPDRKPAADDGIPDLFSRMVASSKADAAEEDTPTTPEAEPVPEQPAAAAAPADSGLGSTPPPADAQDEAPMAVWAEVDEPLPEVAPPPVLRVTRIGAAPPPPPLQAAPTVQADSHVSIEPMAARLRRTQLSDLSAADRTGITVIRARARSLRDRLAAPQRAGH